MQAHCGGTPHSSAHAAIVGVLPMHRPVVQSPRVGNVVAVAVTYECARSWIRASFGLLVCVATILPYLNSPARTGLGRTGADQIGIEPVPAHE
jgi:hypothetical protein